jgi:hypothetical protein
LIRKLKRRSKLRRHLLSDVDAFIMAIPLRKLTSLDSKPGAIRDSLDSQTSAILSYALGTHPDDNDTSDDDDDDHEPNFHEVSTPLDDDEEFFKENDPLTSDYEPFPQKRVHPKQRNVG